MAPRGIGAICRTATTMMLPMMVVVMMMMMKVLQTAKKIEGNLQWSAPKGCTHRPYITPITAAGETETPVNEKKRMRL